MGFFDETIKILDIKKTDLAEPYCCIFPTLGIVIEGYKKILELSETSISVLCGNGKKIDIIGSKLKIKEIAYKEISINGNISSLNFI